MNRGLLIAFEGIDGTGKSTQLQLLAGFLREKGCRVAVTREPTDSIFGQRIRELYIDRGSCTLEEELELFIQDRQQHVRELIVPQLERHAVVLTDRYYYSTAAYQGAAGMDIQEIFRRNAFAPCPDLVILLTMDPEVSVARITEGRGEQLNDFEQLDQLRRVADNFAAMTDPCIHRIDAAAAVQEVQEKIQAAVSILFKEKKYTCP